MIRRIMIDCINNVGNFGELSMKYGNYEEVERATSVINLSKAVEKI